ncbi:hypothetical protein [Streptomyces canus]|uniref:hypothetical protein n=1 Tax=Streptomyces canus TaxID=58343 RepID=UPI00036A7419|nr:hypothetical protein [Streptomyces canus]
MRLVGQVRLVHVDQHYLRAETIAAANAKPIEAQGQARVSASSSASTTGVTRAWRARKDSYGERSR